MDFVFGGKEMEERLIFGDKCEEEKE